MAILPSVSTTRLNRVVGILAGGATVEHASRVGCQLPFSSMARLWSALRCPSIARHAESRHRSSRRSLLQHARSSSHPIGGTSPCESSPTRPTASPLIPTNPSRHLQFRKTDWWHTPSLPFRSTSRLAIGHRIGVFRGPLPWCARALGHDAPQPFHAMLPSQPGRSSPLPGNPAAAQPLAVLVARDHRIIERLFERHRAASSQPVRALCESI